MEFVKPSPSRSVGTLALHLPRGGVLQNELLYSTLLVIGGSLFVALCAQIRIPLPFSAVPITGQTLGVLLVGSALGPRLGVLAMLLYLLQGLIGLPFYAGGASGVEVWHGATAGYLAGFPLAALLTGWLAQRGWDRKIGTTALSMILGNLVIYTLGVLWLSTIAGSLGQAIIMGLLPFIFVDFIKIVVASLVLPGTWKLFGLRKHDQE